MQQVYRLVDAAAKSDATVFITGESGTGKEVCAEAIHRLGARAGKPFIPLNCAAIPRDLTESELFGHVKGAFTGAISDREGAVRLAHGGTLFLDEIGEISPDMQTKLLRFLQTLTYQRVGDSRSESADIRIVCATNKDPLAEIGAGRFREDLFYRLYVLPIHMPLLSRRGDDIIDLAHVLLRRYAAEEKKDFEGFAPETENHLLHYSWPGNIRQLQNVIRHIVVMNDGPLVTPGMLPASLLHGATAPPAAPGAAMPDNAARSAAVIRPLAAIEREAIENAIALCGGNIPKAAAALGLSPSTLYRKKAAWD